MQIQKDFSLKLTALIHLFDLRFAAKETNSINFPVNNLILPSTDVFGPPALVGKVPINSCLSVRVSVHPSVTSFAWNLLIGFFYS